MNFDLISMKKRAKELFKQNLSMIMIMTIIMLIIMYLRAGIFRSFSWQVVAALYVLDVLITGLLKIGYNAGLLDISRGGNSGVSVLVNGFRKNVFSNLITVIIYFGGIYLGSIFFVVPGILLFYRWRFVYFILSDGEKSVLNVYKRSMELTKGHCMELFKMDVSFLGLYFLELITLGIAGVYVIPYTTITYAEYYDYIKGQYELIG